MANSLTRLPCLPWFLQEVPAPRPVPEYSDSSVCTHLWPIGKVFWDGHYGALYLMSEWIATALFEERLFTYRRHGLPARAGYGSVATLIVDGNPSLRRTTNPTFLTVWAFGYVLQLAAIRYAWMRGGK
jgi:hypothetical protein